MINASFNGGKSRLAAISGAYQYDTGQRLKMHGLPSPEAFSAEDDFLSGDLAAVEVHFSRVGDSQSEMRLGVWDIDRKVWMASVPDEYLTISEEIQVHVYVYHGEDGSGVRAQTMYQGVFTPIPRPAPFGITTPEQEEEWQEKQFEIDIALAAVKKAEEGALGVIRSTNKAAEAAIEPAQEAEQAAKDTKAETKALKALDGFWKAATLTVNSLAPDAPATVKLKHNERGVPEFTFGIPRGADGKPGEVGDKGPADVEFVLDGTTLIVNTINKEVSE